MTRERQNKRVYDHAAIYADRQSGMSYVEVAQKHGCSQSLVHYVMTYKTQDDPEIEAALTDAFRKVMGFCPIADGTSRPE